MSTNPKPVSVYLLAVVLTLQSFTALVCGAAMMWDPSGVSMQLPSVVLETAPFKNFFIPGMFLFTCLGLLPLVASFALLNKNSTRFLNRFNIYTDYRVGWMLSLFSGFGNIIWITAQLFFTETYFFLQTVYEVVGLLILILSLWPSTMNYCQTTRST